jgi:subtilisin family serine protease
MNRLTAFTRLSSGPIFADETLMNKTSLLHAGLAALLTLALAACGSSSPLSADLGGGGLPLDPRATAKACSTAAAAAVEERLSLLAPDALGEFVVTFEGEGPLQTPQLDLLKNLGLSGIYLSRLPIAGVLATAEQARALMRTPGVRSVVFNEVLEYEDDVARTLTSVDVAATRPELVNANGEPITGKGVTILVNDSGIDGTHPDLQFGSKVVENVLAATSLKLLSELVVEPPVMLPHTPTEGVPNSDVFGSHGSHVAGIAAGDGSASDGKFAGAARGANLIGYGSGAVILVLDALGGFDYALKILDERPELNLRIVTNSFGSPSDVGTCFDPAHPTNVATKQLADRGVIVVFSAGNSGNAPDTITGNFKKAPWIVIAANGEKSGLLAPSSSRGALGEGAVYQVEVDGEILTVEDRPTVVTPGTNYISARAIAADPFLALDVPADAQDPDFTPEQVPFYTKKTGTSMAAPHVAGLVALLLEANPALTWREVKTILKTTATNIPGYAPFEVGAGFANAEAAIALAMNLRDDYGQTNNVIRRFNSVIGLGDSIRESFDLLFLPAGPSETATFEVSEDIGLVLAQWQRPDESGCTCTVVLTDPNGNRYGGPIALPVLASSIAVSAPGVAGTWTLSVSGIGSVSGNSVDPLRLTNGVSGPAMMENIRVSQFFRTEPVGVDDVAGHPAQSTIEFAVANRLVDGTGNGFAPDMPLLRAQLGEYLMAWGVRQTLPHDGSLKFGDAPGLNAVIAEAMAGSGRLLLDLNTEAAPVMPWLDGSFGGNQPATREQAAYGLVHTSGRADIAAQYSGDLFAFDEEGNMVPVADAEAVSPALRGHVQDALVLGILKPELVSEGGSTVAFVRPAAGLSRAEYAEMAVQALAVLPRP